MAPLLNFEKHDHGDDEYCYEIYRNHNGEFMGSLWLEEIWPRWTYLGQEDWTILADELEEIVAKLRQVNGH